MKVIGLCGGSGSGKSYVAKLFQKYGINSIDTDAVYHELTSYKSECLTALSREFGSSIITENDTLDRSALSKIVFKEGNAELLGRLNEISHYYILKKTFELIEKIDDKTPAVLIDAPLLFESGLDKRCDKVIAVIAPINIRIERICRRDGISPEVARARINAQLSDEILLARADYIIENKGDSDLLCKRIDEIANQITTENN